MNGNLSAFEFDASAVELASSFDPLPAGNYNVIITESEVKETKNGTGQLIALKMCVFDGEFENRIIFSNINFKNAHETTQKIGKQQLASLCKAVGVLTPKDSSDLHDKPLVVKVIISPAKDGYEAKNEVRAFLPYGDAPVAQAPVAPPVTAVKTKKPWEK
jgi:hypothetical protein